MKDEDIKDENIEPSEVEAEINKDNGEPFEDLEFVESTEDGEEVSGKGTAKKLREDLKICRREKEEYLTGWQRAKADYINLKRESEQIHIDTSRHTKERIINDLLPAIDSFDLAFNNKEAWEKVDKNWRIGVEYIHQQFIKVLSDLGVDKIEEVEIPFDAKIHESIENVETDDESKDHMIEKIVQAGYKMGDRVIRPAKVTIYEYKNPS